MTLQEFERLRAHAGMAVPEGVGPCLADIEPENGLPLISPGFFQGAMRRGGVGGEREAMLLQALSAIQSDEKLLRLSRALCLDTHRALILQRACEFERPQPACLQGFAADAYALLYALACLEQGLRQLAGRGIPSQEYEEVCWHMADRQLQHYQKTGDPVIDNYSWDMNFYGCGIFFMDRLYFVPYRWEHSPVYRRLDDGKTLALWPKGQKVRPDGQLDGVNGVHDPRSFTTTWVEDAHSITAYPVNPVGIIRDRAITISKMEWAPALCPGDMTLAAHIPGGEGYTSQRWKTSMEQAKAFFDRWFPEIPTKGFWSESWLYDPGLYQLLPSDGRILSVQRQFYNYPTPEGESMAKLEVFGAEDVDVSSLQPQTSLGRKLRDSLLAGTHYHTSGMFVLHEDLPRFGNMPYQAEEDIQAYLRQSGGVHAGNEG